jgi:hypothetical protein
VLQHATLAGVVFADRPPHDHADVAARFLHEFSTVCDVLIVLNGALENEFITQLPALVATRRLHLGNINYSSAYANESIGRADAGAAPRDYGAPPHCACFRQRR